MIYVINNVDRCSWIAFPPASLQPGKQKLMKRRGLTNVEGGVVISNPKMYGISCSQTLLHGDSHIHIFQITQSRWHNTPKSFVVPNINAQLPNKAGQKEVAHTNGHQPIGH